MKVAATGLLVLLVSTAASVASVAGGQVDAGGDDTAEPSTQGKGQVRNKTTAERISAPNPTTEGVPWSLPVFWDQSLSVRSFNEGSQLSHSPNYTWWFTVAPRWIFNDVHSIGISSTVSLEWTDSPGEEFNRSGFYSREAQWEDLRLDYLISVPGRPGGFMFFVAGDLRLPTSRFSRSRQRYLSPGIRATVVRPIDVLSGMQLGVTAAFWGWFAGSNVVLGPGDVFPCRVAPAPGGGGGSSNSDTCYGANSSTKHTSRLSVFWTFVPVDRLAFGLSYTALWGRANDLAIGCVDTLTGPVCIDDGSANGHWRSFSNFRATVGYDIKRWFTLALSYDVWAQHPDSDGGRENPLYNENARMIFTLTFRADGLYASTRDKRAGGGGAAQTEPQASVR